MKFLQSSPFVLALICYIAFPTTHNQEPVAPVATIEIASQDEDEVLTFEMTFINYDAALNNGIEMFGDIQHTTPHTLTLTSSDFTGIFQKIAGNANLRVTLIIKGSDGQNTLKCGGERCIVAIRDNNGHASRL